jgi:formiminotetrahydrofolate cyclodeaminase
MGRHSRHYTDLNPLEGGGSGGGSGYAAPIAGAIGAAGVLGTTKVMLDKAEKDRAARDTAESAKERLTQKEKQMVQEAKDEEMYQKIKTAPTTKTEMGKAFAKGGSASSRADGCAQRGKTRGTLIR